MAIQTAGTGLILIICFLEDYGTAVTYMGNHRRADRNLHPHPGNNGFRCDDEKPICEF